VQHEPFTSTDDAIRQGSDIVSTTEIVELNSQRVCVRDTDIGRDLKTQIHELRQLLYAYQNGIIKERK
jgi:fructose-1,6-bisphosphatase-3